jgi:uncharacterized cupin superfamily protein
MTRAAVNLLTEPNPGGRIDIGRAVGSTKSVMFVYDLEPGSSSSPYHYEYKEEWLLVVDGDVVVRRPEGEREMTRGDIVCFAAGPAEAHKISSRSPAPARILLFSDASVPAVSVYPDSDKIGVWVENDDDDGIFRRSTAVAWSDGEDGWNVA